MTQPWQNGSSTPLSQLQMFKGHYRSEAHQQSLCEKKKKTFHPPKVPPTFVFACQYLVVEEGGVLSTLSEGRISNTVPLLPNYNCLRNVGLNSFNTMEAAQDVMEPPSSYLSLSHVLDKANVPGEVMHPGIQLCGETPLFFSTSPKPSKWHFSQRTTKMSC